MDTRPTSGQVASISWMLWGKFSSLLTDPQDIPCIVPLSHDVPTSYSHPVISRELSEGQASQVALVEKNLPANVGAIPVTGLTGGSGRLPRGGHGNTLQYSCLESSMDRGS